MSRQGVDYAEELLEQVVHDLNNRIEDAALSKEGWRHEPKPSHNLEQNILESVAYLASWRAAG